MSYLVTNVWCTMVCSLDRRMDHTMSIVGIGDDSTKDEDTVTPLRKTRHRLPSDDSISSCSGTPATKKLRTKASDD